MTKHLVGTDTASKRLLCCAYWGTCDVTDALCARGGVDWYEVAATSLPTITTQCKRPAWTSATFLGLTRRRSLEVGAYSALGDSEMLGSWLFAAHFDHSLSQNSIALHQRGLRSTLNSRTMTCLCHGKPLLRGHMMLITWTPGAPDLAPTCIAVLPNT